jgi:hypothetical protein
MGLPMPKSNVSLICVSALALALAGCASTRPAVPSLAVIPGPNKTQAVFDRDADLCDISAKRATGGQSPGEAANDAAVSTAVVGTAIGALAGAAIGAASGRAGAGAASPGCSAASSACNASSCAFTASKSAGSGGDGGWPNRDCAAGGVSSQSLWLAGAA